MTDLEKPELQLLGMNGNAFAIMGNWQQAAREAGWPKEEIDRVLTEARSGDYNHLLYTIMQNSTEPDGLDDEDEYEYDDEEDD